MESLSRLSSILETTRGLTLEASNALQRPPPRTPDIGYLQKLLDSKHEREVLDGLRTVISVSERSPDAPPILYSAVLKNIASPSLAVKKLVYIYLIQHAEAEPDTALLAINTIQKTLSASDPQLRALALRTMSGIRVPVISQIVCLGIKRSCGDMSPLVRKTAALAIPKCWRLDPTAAPQLTDYLSQLLGDKQYYVVGSAVCAFLEVCPERLDLIHKHYRSLVKKLVDMDEWGQVATLRLLTVYSRRCFPRQVGHKKKSAHQTAEDDDAASSTATHAQRLDPDLSLLLRSALPLLQSRNSSVIVAAVRLYVYCAPGSPNQPSEYIAATAGPLVSLLRSPPEIKLLALQDMVEVALKYPSLFLPYLTRFLPQTSVDSTTIQRLKFEMLTLTFPLASKSAQSLILTELSQISNDSSSLLMSDAARAIGRCAATAEPGSAISQRCLKLLLANLNAPDATLVAESLTVIRHLIQAEPMQHVQTVIRLAKDLDTIKSPVARASIIWLVGEFAGHDDNGRGNIAADVFRILVKTFVDEEEEAKAQIVLLGAKCYLHLLNRFIAEADTQRKAPQPSTEPEPSADPTGQESAESKQEDPPFDISEHPLSKLWIHVLHLVRYDTSYNLRDLARVYKALLPSALSSSWSPDRATTQLATLLLLAPKPVPHVPSPAKDRAGLTYSSASFALAEPVSYPEGSTDIIPDWVKPGHEPDPRLRESEEYESVAEVADRAPRWVPPQDDLPSAGASALERRPGRAVKTLDDWLDEEEDSDDDDEDDDEDDDDDEEEDDSDDDDDEDEDESSDESDDEGRSGEKGRLLNG